MTLTGAHLMQLLSNSKRFDRVIKNIAIKSLGDGQCIAELKVSEEHTNPMGGLHGGFSATLVDNISSYALLSHKNGAAPSVSVDMHITYMKGAQIGDEIEVDAKVQRVGKTLAFLEVFIRNKGSGDILVKGNHTKFLMNK